MRRSAANPWLSRYAALTAASVLGLISLGGLVTSHEAGLAVPDWPTTYGYNMFFFPIEKWTGGIFYEHTHRLAASGIGLLTVILAVWLWLKEQRAWVRSLGLAAVVLVVVQGVLGGWRVVALKDEIGIFHATLAQLFFVLIGGIALVTSRWWTQARAVIEGGHLVQLRRLFLGLSLLILAQLALGATMRHQHAGLAVPDFPLAHGKIWPATDPGAILSYNQSRGEVFGLKPITAGQVWLQMAHRLMAVAIVAGVAFAAWRTRRWAGPRSLLGRLAWTWVGLILTQFGLGAATVWTNKSADIATAHVAVGALSLLTGCLITLVARRFEQVGLIEQSERVADRAREPLVYSPVQQNA